MKHLLAAKRREKMAAAVKHGGTIDSTAARFRVHPTTVRFACKEHSVAPVDRRRAYGALLILAAIAHSRKTREDGPGESYAAIAARLGVSRQRVHDVAQQAKDLGLL